MKQINSHRSQKAGIFGKVDIKKNTTRLPVNFKDFEEKPTQKFIDKIFKEEK